MHDTRRCFIINLRFEGLKDSPLNSACVVENLCCYFKQIISYEKTKLKK